VTLEGKLERAPCRVRKRVVPMQQERKRDAIKSSGALGLLGYFLFCAILLLSACWMVWQIWETDIRTGNGAIGELPLVRPLARSRRAQTTARRRRRTE
jgi:hypothetical protein